MNMFLHGIEDFQIERGDTLKNPAFFTADGLTTFDCVIANPPFSLKDWGAKSWTNDPYGRNIAGTPPDSNGDMAWVQHMIQSLKPNTGRMAIILPHGVLFRKGAEGKIRQALIEKDLLEAVIGLGANIFYGTQLAACILVFSQNKKKDKKDKVLFIDASEQIRVGRAQNFLEPEHVDKIYQWYKSFQDVENYVKVVSISEIIENEFNLNIPLYVEKSVEDNLPSVEQALSDLKVAWKESVKADEQLKKELELWG
jgi:type I restriction enzyme M protein